MNTIGVIGSGPSGASAALTLLRAGQSVVMFDIGAVSNSIHDENVISNVPSSKNLKTYMGEVFPYDINEYNQIHIIHGEKKWFTSKGLGGFSTVWGATWKPFRSLNSLEWLDAIKEVEDLVFGVTKENSTSFSRQEQMKIDRGCSCFQFINSSPGESKDREKFSWNLISSASSLAVFNSKCNFTGRCQQGCDTGAIWNARQLIEECNQYDTFSYISNCYVEKTVESDSSVSVETSLGNFMVDYLVVAAGPVATSTILLNSYPQIESIELKDTQMILIPFLRFKRAPKHNGAFTLSGIDFDFTLKSREAIQMHMQLYAHTDYFLDRVKLRFNTILHPFFTLLFRVLKRNLYIGILYVDSRWSGSLEVTARPGTTIRILESESLNNHSGEIRNALKALKNYIGLWPIWMGVKFESVGDSYHLGFAQGDFISTYGDLQNSSRIKAAGSFALKTLEPGPITMTAMAQSILCVRKLLSTLPKF